MKIVFLDIDGVLNVPSAELGFREMGLNWRAQDWAENQSRLNGYSLIFSPQAVYNLHRIIEETDAKIVISSTWRRSSITADEMRVWFSDPLIAQAVIDKTPILNSKQRGDEIKAWLDEHPEVTRSAVIDDDGDMDAVRQDFFKVDGYEGLDWKTASSIIAHLNYKKRSSIYRINVALDKLYRELCCLSDYYDPGTIDECLDEFAKKLEASMKDRDTTW